MKSCWIVTRDHHAILEFRDVPIPKAKPGQVIVQVNACALNRGELIVGGAVHGGPEKLGGTECSGVIHELGEGVTGGKVGDRVMGRARGTFAEYTVMIEGQIMPAPAHLSWQEAAAIPSSFLTSYEAVVRYGGLARGDWLLVSGASSGVGVGALLIAKVIGARTIGTSGSAEKLAKLKAVGLDVAIQTRAADFSGRVLEVTGGNGANVAINLTGGTAFPEIVRSMSRDGRIVIVGYVDGVYNANLDLNATHLKRLQIIGISNAKLTDAERVMTTAGFKRDILPAIMDGRVKPLIDRVFSFNELPAAKAHMEADAMVGKIVVTVP
jgi:NADPH:quinone reductase-like Zn-dependent oxidoreductase